MVAIKQITSKATLYFMINAAFASFFIAVLMYPTPKVSMDRPNVECSYSNQWDNTIPLCKTPLHKR